MSRLEFRKVKIVDDERRPLHRARSPQRPSKRWNYRKRNEAPPPLPSRQTAGAPNVAA
jgi:hypothetical protein